MSWVDIAEAAFTLGVSERTVRNWIKSGKLEARNIDGRREVNIPDSEDARRATAFDDDDDDGASLDTQKRLEVALIECGRVKGTLASQERMMENLSANIAELNAKLHKSERAISTRTIWVLVVAFLGVIAVLSIRFIDDIRINEAKAAYYQEAKALSDKNKQDSDSLRAELKKDEEKLRGTHAEAMEALRSKLAEEHLKAIDVLNNKHQQEIVSLRAEMAQLNSALREADEKRVRAEDQLHLKTKEIELIEMRLADLQKIRQQLEDGQLRTGTTRSE